MLPTETVDAAVLRLDGSRYLRTAGDPSTARDLHYWASAGKLFTALGILVLEEEGRLSLNDPISNYLSGIPDGELITLEMLLNHTSGLFSANEDAQVRASNKLMTLEDEIAVLQRHGNLFCPGTNWRYSNSGYALLAEVIEQVSGQSYHSFVDGQVIAKTQAERLRVMAAGERPENVVALSQANGDVREVINHFGGAGSVIGDAESMAAFVAGVFEGSVVSETTLNRMTQQLYPMFHSASDPSQPTRYNGLGTMVYVAISQSPPSYLMGHSGGLDGASSFVGWSARHQAVVVVALTGAGSADLIASRLAPALE
ncbi:serine hydrolase domain-containing protein [Parasedimentitalea huanghaiensis]|nr:serine hydrolase domain-containing protein [Zongyanglinia huanghaiensis]